MTKTNSTFIGRGNQRYQVFRSTTFNIDNGSGATLDDVIFSNLPYGVEVKDIQAVYVEATDTAGAEGANFSAGLTAGGTGVCAATALAGAKAVGATTPATIVDGYVPAGGALFVRHTGIASTEAGQYYLQVRVLARP